MRLAPVPFLLIAALAQACAHGDFPDPRAMRFPRPAFSPSPTQRKVMANGTVMHLLPDHEVPLVAVRVMVRTGAVLDPPDRAGLAEMTGRLLRSGGTRDLTGDELNRELEGMGAILETGIGSEAGSASLSVLSEDLERGLELLAQVLRHPVFDASKLEKERGRKLEEIRRSDDDPDDIAFRIFRALLYGGDPRGRTPTSQTVTAISRGDVVGFHESYFHPDRLIVGVSGDFEEEELLDLWERYFGDWRPAGRPADLFPVPDDSPSPAVHLARKEFPQATILLGHLAPPLESPDYYAFAVVNYILGGAGFNSRLTEEIRSNRGLAYSVGSMFRGDVGYGVFFSYCKTKPGTALESLRLIRDIAEKMSREGVTAEELSWARESILNGLIFSLETSSEIVSRRVSQEYEGLPADYLERLPERFEAVTLDQVQDAARRHLRPLQAKVVIVGGDRLLGEGLEDFGEVREVPLAPR